MSFKRWAKEYDAEGDSAFCGCLLLLIIIAAIIALGVYALENLLSSPDRPKVHTTAQ